MGFHKREISNKSKWEEKREDRVKMKTKERKKCAKGEHKYKEIFLKR